MKKIRVTFTVFVEDSFIDPLDFNPLGGLYEHICEWEGNTEGTVEFEFDEIIENAIIGE